MSDLRKSLEELQIADNVIQAERLERSRVSFRASSRNASRERRSSRDRSGSRSGSKNRTGLSEAGPSKSGGKRAT